METRANFVLIGLFTLAAIFAGFGFVWWFTVSSGAGERMVYDVEFRGSVAGLGPGSGVLFNGIRVGSVRGVRFDAADPRRVLVAIDVPKDTPVRTDTAVRLDYNFLTGVASIALAGGAPDAPGVVQPDGRTLTLKGDTGGMQDLIGQASGLMSKADATLAALQALVDKNEAPVSETIDNIRRFSGALASNSDDVSRFLGTTSAAAEKIGALADRLGAITDEVEALARAVSPEKVGEVVDNAVAFSRGLEDTRNRVNGIVEEATGVVSGIKASVATLDETLSAARGIVTAVDPAKVSGIVDGVGRTVENAEKALAALDIERISRSVENVDKFATVLGDNAENADKLIKNAAEISDTLTGAATDLRALIASVDTAKINAAVDGVAAVVASIDTTKISGIVDSVGRTVESAEKALASIDTEKISRSVDNVDRFAAALGTNAENADKLIKNATEISQTLTGAATDLRALLTAIDATKINDAVDGLGKVIASVDPDKVSKTVDNVSSFSDTLKANQGEVDRLVKNAAEISDKLKGTADRLDSLLANADKLIGGFNEDGSPAGGMMADISAAAKSIRTLADNLDSRTAAITEGINGVTGRGMRQIETLVDDGRRTLGQLDRLIRNIDRNPQRFLFGGKSGIPDYSGR